MTDVTLVGRQDPVRLSDNAFQRIVEGHEDLQHPDGTPIINRLATVAGVPRKRLNEVATNKRGRPGLDAINTVIRIYAHVQGTSYKEAMAAVLADPDAADIEAVAA